MTQPHDNLWDSHPATGRDHLIQYNPHFMDETIVAAGFADAARRLRDSYRSEAWDDVILLPFRFLWRHAIEVQMKIDIRSLTTLRRREGDSGVRVASNEVANRLRYKIGHDLRGLVSELNEHIQALKLKPLTVEVLATIEGLAGMDNRSGTAFRYTGILAAGPADLNIDSLATSLNDAYEQLSVVVDAATHGEGV